MKLLEIVRKGEGKKKSGQVELVGSWWREGQSDSKASYSKKESHRYKGCRHHSGIETHPKGAAGCWNLLQVYDGSLYMLPLHIRSTKRDPFHHTYTVCAGDIHKVRGDQNGSSMLCALAWRGGHTVGSCWTNCPSFWSSCTVCFWGAGAAEGFVQLLSTTMFS